MQAFPIIHYTLIIVGGSVEPPLSEPLLSFSSSKAGTAVSAVGGILAKNKPEIEGNFEDKMRNNILQV